MRRESMDDGMMRSSWGVIFCGDGKEVGVFVL